MKKEKILGHLKRLIAPILGLVVILIGVFVIATWEEKEEEAEAFPVYSYEGEHKQLTLENEKWLMNMNTETTHFSLTDKQSGAVWLSNPEGIEEDVVSLGAEKNKLQSTVLLTYSTQNGVDTQLNNYEYSIAGSIYAVEKGDDYIRVDYSIGDIDKEYIIPSVLEADRMEAYQSGMSRSAKMMLGQYYKKYDINDLSKSDEEEKDALIARYPLMETEVIYALRDGTTENLKSKMEEYFAEQGYTYDEYVEDKAKDTKVQSSEKPVFNVSVVYRLDGDDFVVEVPYDNLAYKAEYPIYDLSVLPYFGAAGTTDEGFVFVPEGGGAIINYNSGKTNHDPYYAEMYGWDYGQDRDAVVTETRTNFNVFGAATNGSSYICIIEGGAPYAAVQADISGRNNSYNSVNAVYKVLHREEYDVGDKTNDAMFVYEDGTVEGEGIVQRYRFVDSADYVDMAKCYRGYLEEVYKEYLVEKDDSQAPVVLEIVGAVDKIKQICGVPTLSPLELTTYEEAEEMIQELYADGLNNMSVKLTGWMNAGVQQKMLDSVKLVKELGNKADLQDMVADAAEKDIKVYFNGITNYAINSDLGDGFVSYRDASKFLNKEMAKSSDFNRITYAKDTNSAESYLLKADVIYKMMDKLVENANEYQASVSFDDVGYLLSSDFYQKNLVSRQQAMKGQQEKLQSIVDSGMDVMLNGGNDYAVLYADIVTNMDLKGTQYSIIDKQVPFYQLAIHGLVNYTGNSVNLAKDAQLAVLNAAEYGAGLSFTMMKESTFTLQNTLYSEYFGSDYSAWHNDLVEIYSRYNDELGHTFNQKMADHEYITKDLTCTSYEDGTKVYVNYSDDEVRISDGTVILPQDYYVAK